MVRRRARRWALSFSVGATNPLTCWTRRDIPLTSLLFVPTFVAARASYRSRLRRAPGGLSQGARERSGPRSSPRFERLAQPWLYRDRGPDARPRGVAPPPRSSASSCDADPAISPTETPNGSSQRRRRFPGPGRGASGGPRCDGGLGVEPLQSGRRQPTPGKCSAELRANALPLLGAASPSSAATCMTRRDAAAGRTERFVVAKAVQRRRARARAGRCG